MPIQDNGYVGMVDRDVFDEWLRERASIGRSNACSTEHLNPWARDADGIAVVNYPNAGPRVETRVAPASARAIHNWCRWCGVGSCASVNSWREARALCLCVPRSHPDSSRQTARPHPGWHGYDGRRCDIFYQGSYSPDFYAWVFPHGDTTSIGTGSAHKGFSLKDRSWRASREHWPK